MVYADYDRSKSGCAHDSSLSCAWSVWNVHTVTTTAARPMAGLIKVK